MITPRAVEFARERAVDRAVNSETLTANWVLRQPREATIRPSEASKKPLVKGVIEF